MQLFLFVGERLRNSSAEVLRTMDAHQAAEAAQQQQMCCIALGSCIGNADYKHPWRILRGNRQ